jgi:hypothetical protein
MSEIITMPFVLSRSYGCDVIRNHGRPHENVDFVIATRRGGVSFGRNELNLSRGTGDADANVYANRQRFFRAAGAEAESVFILRQVHSDRIVKVDESDVTTFNDRRVEADGMITASPNLWLSISIGDCVPVCLYEPESGVLAMLHSGWRSTAAGISSRAVEIMAGEHGARPGSVRAVIGPGISSGPYQVDRPVLEAFEKNGFPMERVISDRQDGIGWLNLSAAIEHSLLEAGVAAENISKTDLCTHTLKSLFFSHRRDGLPGGRMMAIGRIRP